MNLPASGGDGGWSYDSENRRDFGVLAVLVINALVILDISQWAGNGKGEELSDYNRRFFLCPFFLLGSTGGLMRVSQSPSSSKP